ncbi:MAG: hypothetical protein JWQ34_3624 [Mucilaginibacter sp.]|uniref:hypothetical protein n=1 Tax=Mucilaginibacter sp. TaxID=1882438 RepID=UPI002631AB36|nr:hypothetical protein [Mucilaginibacter sp.]MDB5005399.1 hypothetical protein [Mucilaginibacter sp.]
MKKTMLLLCMLFTKAAFCQQADLNKVTFGFGAGYSHTFNKVYDYSLTTDGNYNLKAQELSKNAFVISSVVMVKLGKIFVDDGNQLFKQNTTKGVAKAPADLLDRMSVNISLNLINVTSDVAFNKSIDGGLGLGYFLSENLQVALFYDITQKRQLRDYVIKSYENLPVPSNANTVYNALDPNDDKLFYNKTISGFSLKLVFSLANKKDK